MSNAKALKIILTGGVVAGVAAVAIGVSLAMNGDGNPQLSVPHTDSTSLGVPAPGYAGLIDEMIANDDDELLDAPISLRVPAPGFAGQVEEMIVLDDAEDDTVVSRTE